MVDFNSLIGPQFDSVAGIASGITDKLGGAAFDLADSADTAFSSLSGFASGLTDRLGGAAFDLADAADTALSSLSGGSIGSLLGKAVLGGAAASAIGGALKGGVAGLFGDAAKGISDVFSQISTVDTLRDFQHASRIFAANNMARSPKMGNLYHVFFDVNTTVSNAKKIASNSIIDAGVMVKSVSLPSFQMDAKALNAYNRSSLVQTKLKYEPMTIVFHDDMANKVNSFWQYYYTHYFGDGTHAASVYNADHRYKLRRSASWGYGSNPAVPGYAAAPIQPFFNCIKVYQLHKREYSVYCLYNPIIKSWQHGSMASNSSDPVDSTMVIEFEAVTYSTGPVSSATVSGFGGKSNYDTGKSPIATAGGARNITGQGGLVDSADSVLDSFSKGNFLEAGMGVARMAKTFGGADFGAMAQTELKSAATGFITDTISASAGKFSFPGLSFP